jgi:23S rRNA pseudouridine955/2504/2580 synthase
MADKNQLLIKSSNIIVADDFAGQRIDNFLFNQLKNIPKSRIYKMLRHGEVRINKHRVKPLYKLQPSDIIRIPPYWADPEEDHAKPKPAYNLTNLLLNNIIFENERIIVLNKPINIASHGGSGINFGVIETLRAARPDLKNLQLVHRLDRDTSGCIILAKKRSALRELHELIRNGKIYKKYILLVRGKWKDGKRIVSESLLKNHLSSGERIVVVNKTGKEAITIFRPIKIDNDISLIEAELKTGRTHQIRVHAAHIGYPIVGDDKYGDKEFNRKMKLLGLKRLFLHAQEISFIWPGSNNRVCFTAEPEMQFEVRDCS